MNVHYSNNFFPGVKIQCLSLCLNLKLFWKYNSFEWYICVQTTFR